MFKRYTIVDVAPATQNDIHTFQGNLSTVPRRAFAVIVSYGGW